MLSDPLSVTYNSVAKSLVRISATKDFTKYRTADSEFEITISNSELPGNQLRVKIALTHNNPDPSPDYFTNNPAWIPNAFALEYTVNKDLFLVSTDVPLLRTALLAFVDSTLQGRILAGEK